MRTQRKKNNRSSHEEKSESRLGERPVQLPSDGEIGNALVRILDSEL
jgi:hypothetical protein